jgi:hypothetical protein
VAVVLGACGLRLRACACICSSVGASRHFSLEQSCYLGETRELPLVLVNDRPEPAEVTSIVTKQDGHEKEEPHWTIAAAN